jgi:hypothetical protein
MPPLKRAGFGVLLTNYLGVQGEIEDGWAAQIIHGSVHGDSDVRRFEGRGRR